MEQNSDMRHTAEPVQTVVHLKWMGQTIIQIYPVIIVHVLVCVCVCVCAYALQHFPVIKVVSMYTGVQPVFQKLMSFWWLIWVTTGKHITYDTVMDYKLIVLFCLKNSKRWFVNPLFCV